MGRKVRKVPPDWKHPTYINPYLGEVYKPMFEYSAYIDMLKDWEESVKKYGLEATLDDFNGPLRKEDFMPEWSPEQATHYMMYEDTTEGTPISPAFATKEELASWLSKNGASVFGDNTTTYSNWLKIIG
jgi:hypothetical protein